MYNSIVQQNIIYLIETYMIRLCTKKTFITKLLNQLQQFFGITKHHSQKVTHQMRIIHKRVIHRAYHKKHHDLAYIHIVLLGICFTLYNFTAFNNADDILVPMQETQIVIENEPQMIPDQASDESETSDEDVSNDILDQTLAESLQTTSTQEIMT